jgi:hypothetical protein
MAARAARPLTAARAAPARRTAPARARAAPTPPRAAGGAPAEPAPAALREAAALVADRWVSSGAAVGLGTGAAVSALLKELAARLADGRLMHVRAVPSSDATASEAAFAGVPLATLADAGGALDLLVDVASELVSAASPLTEPSKRENAGRKQTQRTHRARLCQNRRTSRRRATSPTSSAAARAGRRRACPTCSASARSAPPRGSASLSRRPRATAPRASAAR